MDAACGGPVVITETELLPGSASRVPKSAAHHRHVECLNKASIHSSNPVAV